MVNIDVITYCSGYPFAVFDRFAGSLNDTGFKGKIHIIVNDFDIPIIKQLRKKHKNVFPIKDTLPKKTHINCHRFFCIRTLLWQVKLECDYILLCDARDVLFQKNIEEYPYDPATDIYGCLEGITIEKEQVYNARWIRQIETLIQEPFYDKICANPVICCGTTIGKREHIKVYVDQMCDTITKYNIVSNLDQGLHNYMLYLNTLNANICFTSNSDNLVNTVGNDLHRVNDDGLIINKHDEVSWVVHQYDRFSQELKRKISVKYDFTI